MGMTMTQKILAAHAGLDSTLHRIKISNQQRTQNRSVNLQRIRDLAGILNRENQE